MLPAPTFDGPSLLRHPVVIGVLPADPSQPPGRAIARAHELVAAGADLVDVCPVAGAPPAAPGGPAASARWSPAELVAGLVESGIPTVATVQGIAHIHLATGSGATVLRDASGDDTEALHQSGLPVIVPGGAVPADPIGAGHELPAGWLAEGSLADLADPAAAAPPTHGVPVRPLVADVDDRSAADPVTVAAQVTVALAAGVRVFRTPDPRTVRRVAHVVTAIEAAR